MGGAYTAKPAASTTPDVPPGWSILWPPPPMPYPPGYEPDLSITMTAPLGMAPSDSIEASLGLFDYLEYPTHEPETGITYSATWKESDAHAAGEVVLLRVEGSGEFSSEVELDYEDVGGGFWGSVPTFEFDTGLPDVGEYVVLRADSSPLGQGDLEAEVEILIEAGEPPEITFSITAVVSGDEDWVNNPARGYFFLGTLVLAKLIGHPLFPSEVSSYSQGVFSSDGDFFFPDAKEWTNWSNVHANCAEMEVTAVDEAISISISDLGEDDPALSGTYYLSMTQQHIRIAECCLDVTIRTYDDGVLKQTETYSRTNDAGSYTFTTDFATINSETGVITMLDPPVTTFV